MKQDLILAIDQGTTGTTALLVNKQLKILSSCNIEYKQHYPKPGWVEHDLDDIWASTIKAIRTAVRKAKVSTKQISAIGIANQRETVCFWSKKTGKPLCRAIVWQDRRTTDFCNELKKSGVESDVAYKTGLVIDPYFSASKIRWAIDNIPAVQQALSKNDLQVGTIDSFLVSRLTHNEVHATETSNASRTMLFSLDSLSWDDELLKLFKIPEHILPEVKKSVDKFGVTKKVPGLPDGIPICGILGDQQSALMGQACLEPGTAKCTYGTGSFILMNTGTQIRRSSFKQLTTVAWTIGGTTQYALEGAAFTAGAAVQWVRDGLKLIKKSSDIEDLAKKVKTTDGVVFVPAFVGIGSPHWAPEARASFFGITRGSTSAHLARAVLEGIAMMNHDILKAMEKDIGSPLKSLNVDGGASQNNLLMQFQADVLGTKLIRPKMVETTALGAVFAAGLGAGIWKELTDIKKSWRADKEFEPKMIKKERDEKVATWNKAIHLLKL